MALNTYLSDVTSLLHDPTNLFYASSLLTTYVNEARSVVATEGECVRRLATINTAAGTETYQAPVAIDTTNGVRDAIDVKSIAVNWAGTGGSNKPMLARFDWTRFQAYYRFYGGNLQGNPESFSIGPYVAGFNPGSGGTGMSGMIYLAPIPSSVLPMELDCVCNVVDLAADTDPDPIPYPYNRIVKYYAAYLALLTAQRKSDSDAMFRLYNDRMTKANSVRESAFIPWAYGVE